MPKRYVTTAKEPYDFNKPIEQIRWTVEGFIPSVGLFPFISKEGVGKSFFLEALAVAIIHGSKFIGRKTLASDVLLIDQDTTQDVLDRRLKALNSAIAVPKVRELYQLKKEVSLDDGSLVDAINEYRSAKVVIIDSLHSVCGKLDPNSTRDMMALSELKAVPSKRAILLTHHVSTHNPIRVDEMMSEERIGNLSMGSSAILQQADAYYVLGSKATSDLDQLYIRPVQKRIQLKIKPFVAKLKEDEQKGTKKFAFDRNYEKQVPLYEIDKDILLILKDRWKKKKEPIGIPKLFDEELNRKYSMWTVRDSIYRLHDTGRVIEHKLGVHKFVFEYNPN
ncbi:MAG TPA: AAA family ATPase [Patescibacteria group bacterium]|nr:AAA family ATPase [Patescibacteria group bacterium]